MQDIFKFNEWDEVYHHAEQYYDVEFLQDFGHWKKGQKIKVLFVDYDTRTMSEFNEQNDEVNTYNWNIF